MKDYVMQANGLADSRAGGRGTGEGVKEQRKQRGTSSTGWMDHASSRSCPLGADVPPSNHFASGKSA